MLILGWIMWGLAMLAFLAMAAAPLVNRHPTLRRR
jgi:hypothetical protein